MDAETIGEWLGDLASAAPSPGGGAAAAMNAAIGAALISMVCNLTVDNPRYAEHKPTMSRVRDRADALRRDCLSLADADSRAFGAVVAAYKLPKATEEDKRARTGAIQDALAHAAEVPLRTAALAAEVIDLAEDILPGANVNVLSDVAVAASSARAALDSAVVNVEINLAAMHDEAARRTIAGPLAGHASAASKAERIAGEVRRRIAG